MDVISPDLPQFMKLIIALGIVLALMGALTLLLKKLGLATENNIKTNGKRRLKVMESLPLDARRRLVILKCDNKEHLVILGPNGEIVIDKSMSSVDGSSLSDSPP